MFILSPSFDLFLNPQFAPKKGRSGVMIITKDNIKVLPLELSTKKEAEKEGKITESVWASVTSENSSTLVIGSFYRQPDSGIVGNRETHDIGANT